MVVLIKQRMYGDYKCSCGCGQLLDGECVGIGDEADIEGHEWRMFTKECWTEMLQQHYERLIAICPASPLAYQV